ncbi:hypothetical protein, partial [Terribacillus saccharophilus]|uniref:hypothetical protein n=1 Tax=Terribacillus saccharophilus TaxID=361277 RepID=UPI002DC469EE|nr:hypothetical protein [Terribacillus saccharophilus]
MKKTEKILSIHSKFFMPHSVVNRMHRESPIVVEVMISLSVLSLGIGFFLGLKWLSWVAVLTMLINLIGCFIYVRRAKNANIPFKLDDPRLIGQFTAEVKKQLYIDLHNEEINLALQDSLENIRQEEQFMKTNSVNFRTGLIFAVLAIVYSWVVNVNNIELTKSILTLTIVLSGYFIMSKSITPLFRQYKRYQQCINLIQLLKDIRLD